MKATKFVILLTILLIGVVNPAVVQGEITIWPCKCSDLNTYSVTFGNEYEHFDIIVLFLNFLEDCKKEDLKLFTNKFVTKQIELMNEFIEMPGKLKKNEELKKECSQKLKLTKNKMKKSEEAFKACNKTEEMNVKEMKLALQLQQQECNKSLEVGDGPWKVLAFTLIGIIAALLLFNIGAVVYYYKF